MHVELKSLVVMADLPVGLNYQDHVSAFTDIFLDEIPFNESQHVTISKFQTISSFIKYLLFGKGPLTTGPVQAVSFFDVDGTGDFCVSEEMPKVQIHSLMGPLQDDPNDDINQQLNKMQNLKPNTVKAYGEHNTKRVGFLATACVLHPQSRGAVSLASADPLQRPIINPNFLSETRDRVVLKAGLRHIRDLVKTRAISSLGGYTLDSKYPTRERIAPDADPESEEYLEELMEHFGQCIWHPAGSCKMGAEGDTSAVVDPQLRVQGGIQGLRVVDNSIMPHLTSGNTNAPAIMIGEKGSDLILQSYK
ncbi:hypothetical protein EB796_014239 [Bugula neritina]|uniref:Glucose-methanol-choline oxidoreductase C-terminal domain-containing protein n=1 Tax=Bugula neritina TaxID=10212 RepID=A0A7J7JMA7_BUGNE|nr:hypothetical protein EB796_014239 [Bugula neritina]